MLIPAESETAGWLLYKTLRAVKAALKIALSVSLFFFFLLQHHLLFSSGRTFTFFNARVWLLSLKLAQLDQLFFSVPLLANFPDN